MLYLTATGLSVDTDEGRFTLVIETDDIEPVTVDIHGIDLDTFYDQVKGRIGPWLQEKEAAHSEFKRAVQAGAFLCQDPEGEWIQEMARVVAIREDGSARMEPDEEPFDFNDPEHPRYHSTHADIWDQRAGK